MAFRNDRLLHPRKNTDSRGNLVFDVHPAKLLLRQDVEAGVHLKMDHFQLRQTRLEYKDFSPPTIYKRILQEERRKKLTHHMNLKRLGKQHKSRQSCAENAAVDLTEDMEEG